MNVFYEVIRYFSEKEQAEMTVFSNHHPTEIRVRTGQRSKLIWPGGEAAFGEAVSEKSLSALVLRMVNHSIYAWEYELGQGYFTLPFGVRVGVTGRFLRENGKQRMIKMTSLLVRIPRESKGAAQELGRFLSDNGVFHNMIILSPPGKGKTTILRDACRLLSGQGKNVSVVDERGEIAAVRDGQAQLDIGERTDVCEGLHKADAIMMLVRSMAPDVIVVDEIGSRGDAEALYEAARMGVGILASAHAGNMADALSRPMIRDILMSGTFDYACVLGGCPGKIKEIHVFSEGRWQLKSSLDAS